MSENAPEYSKRERLIIVLKLLAWGFPIYVLIQFWFFDWLAEYSNNANCYQYGNITGVHVVFYGLFVFMPLSCGYFLFDGRSARYQSV